MPQRGRLALLDRHLLRGALATCAVVLVAACHEGRAPAAADSTQATAGGAIDAGIARPDQYPVVVNTAMPFRYPPALYADKTQGDVTLRLYVDQNGSVVDDSTQIAESSHVPLLDSAALKGAHDLRFVPAKLHGVPMPVTILFPVYFRHPEATPPAGDSALSKLQRDLLNVTKPSDSGATKGGKKRRP